MADCIEAKELLLGGAKILKIDNLTTDKLSAANEEKAKKPYKFDTHQIRSDMYYDMFFGTKTNNVDAFSRIQKVVGNSNAIKKLFGVNRNVDKNNPLFADLHKKNPTSEEKIQAGQRMQIRGLVMKHIIGTIKSDRDVQNNLNINDEEALKSLYSDGSRKVATLGMATAIGRDIAYSMGFKVSADSDVANRMYNEIGLSAINEVADKTKLITVDTGDSIINNDFKEDKYTKFEGKTKIIKGYTTVRMNYKKFPGRGKDLTAEQIGTINNAFEEGRSLELMAEDYSYMKTVGLIDGSARYVGRMSIPSNLAVPTENASTTALNKDIVMSGVAQTLFSNMQQIPGQVNPRVGTFFLYLNSMVEEAKKEQLSTKVDYDFETIIKKHIGADKELLNFVFGTFDTTSSIDTKSQAIGQSLSKTSTVKELIEDAGRYFHPTGEAKPIFFQHEMYRTGRVGYIQSIMNPQTDKFFSRFVLDGGKYTIKTGGKAHVQLINGIKDDSGISVEQIMGTDTSNDGLEFILNQYNKTYNSGLKGKASFDAQKKLHQMLSKGNFREKGKLHTLPKLKGSLWQKLSSIEGIYDVRSGTNNKITTRFQTKPDATGSGIILQLAQMIGLDGSHDTAMEKLGELGLVTGQKQKVRDVYGFLENAITKSMEPLVVPNDDGSLDYKKVGDLDINAKEFNKEVEVPNIFIQKMINLEISKDLRDIAKPATMITSYLAGPATVKAETGEAYVQAIFDVLEGRNASQEQLTFVGDLLKSANEDLYNDIGKITNYTLLNTPGVKSALEQHISSTVGSHMYTLIGESLTEGGLESFHTNIKSVYEAMQKLSKNQDLMIAEGKADRNSAFQLKTLPAGIVMDMKDFPKDKSWKNKDGSMMSEKQLLDKYGMMITSPSQIVENVVGEDTLVRREAMNSLTALVNVIHSMDSAIMFRAHRNTRKAMGLKEGKFSMSIHDANNADAEYNAIFQDMYREALIEVVGSYDMLSQMMSAYNIMEKARHKDNTAIMNKDDHKKLTDRAKKSKKIKEQMFNDDTFNLKSEKTFGFKDDFDYTEETEPEPEPESKKKSKPELKEKSNEDFVNPFIDKTSKNTQNMTSEEVELALETSINPAVVLLKKNPFWKSLINKKGNNSFYDVQTNSLTLKLVPKGFSVKEVVEHEVTHFMTHTYLATPEAKKTVAYKELNKAFKLLNDNYLSIAKELESKNQITALSRLNYIFEDSKLRGMSELTAILSAEHTSTDEIFAAVDVALKNKKASTGLKRIIDLIMKAINIKLEKQEFNLEELRTNIANLIQNGYEFNERDGGSVAQKVRTGIVAGVIGIDNTVVSPEREAFMKKMRYKPYEPVDAYADKIPYVEEVIPLINNMTSSFIGNVVMDSNHTFKGQKQLAAADKYLSENFPIYKMNREALLNYADINPMVQRMKGFLDPERFGDRITMEQMISMQDKATQERGTMDNRLISNMKKLMHTMKPEEVTAIYNVTSQAPVFHLHENNIMTDLVNGNKNLDSEIARLEKELGDTDIKKAQRMADMLSGKDGHRLNLYDGYNSDGSGIGNDVQKVFEQLVALKTIKNTKNYKEGFALLKDNKELYDLIMDASVGLKTRVDLVYNKKHYNRKGKQRFTDAKRYRENLIVDTFEEEYDIEAVTSTELAEGEYSTDNGWKMLRKPNSTEYGIMYRPSKDETYQQGAGTTISYKHNDVIVPKSKQLANPRNVLSTDVGQDEKRHKMILTQKEKDKLGLNRNPADAIYRSLSRVLEIEETAQIRDLVLSVEFTKKVSTENDLKAFDKALGDMKPEDRKWLVALPDGITKSDIVNTSENGKYKYPNIQKYYKVPERVSSVGNFRHNFDLVRIDAEPWLTGYKDAILFENTPSARTAAYVVRQAVKWTKITWTALSPIKIMNDAIANSLVLLGYDVPPLKIHKYGQRINKQIGEFEKLRVSELEARVHGKKDRAERIAKQIENHPMAMMMHNGMMQSINIELFQRDQSVVTGIQKDIEKLLNDHLLLPDGEKSSLFKGIKYLQEYGDWGVESVLEFASKGAKQVEALEALGDQLEASAEKIKGMKKSEKDETMAKYISEFMMTPSSEAVQFGSTLVQRADIIARGILVQHMMDEGSTEQEAVIAATDAFINYKQNMPKELKLLSDYGILLFPSFWMRIQRVMWSLIKRNPATALTALSMEEIIQLNIPTIFDANLVAKWDQGVFGLPPVMGFWQ